MERVTTTRFSCSTLKGTTRSTHVDEIMGIRPDIPNPDTTRIRLRPDGYGFHTPSVVLVVSFSFKMSYLEPYINFEEVPCNVLEQWWKNFKRFCTWDTELESLVRHACEFKLKDKLRDSVYKITERHTNKSWMSDEVYEKLKKRHAEVKFKERSMRNKQNQRKGVGDGDSEFHSGYVQGSLSSIEVTQQLTRQLGRPPTDIEVFLEINHRLGKGKEPVLVTQEAERVVVCEL